MNKTEQVNAQLDELTKKDMELNNQYIFDMMNTKDIEEYQKRMEIKTRWYRLELYKIMNK